MRKIIYLLFVLVICSCGSDNEEIGDGGNVNNNIPPNPPSLITPNNNATIVTQIVDEEVYFEWTNATDPDNDIVGYRIWIDTDSNFSNPFHHGININNTTSYLPINQTYYWRVTTIDSNENIRND